MDDRQRKFGIQTRRFRAVRSLRWPAVVLFIFHNFQPNSMNSTERFLFVNIPCDYYPDPPLCVLYLFTVWQRRDWGATCQGNSLRTTSNNPCSVSETILSLPLPFPFPNINQAFHSLTFATFLRAEKSKHPEDVKYSVIRYLPSPSTWNTARRAKSLFLPCHELSCPCIVAPGGIKAWRCGSGHRGDDGPLPRTSQL
jgi:hypothetical protein